MTSGWNSVINQKLNDYGHAIILTIRDVFTAGPSYSAKLLQPVHHLGTVVTCVARFAQTALLGTVGLGCLGKASVPCLGRHGLHVLKKIDAFLHSIWTLFCA